MHKSLWMLWAVSVISAIFAAGLGWQVEHQYRKVALVIDGNEARILQALTGKPMPELLTELKQFGATGIAVSAELLSDQVQNGKVKVENETLIASNRQTLSRIRSAIERQFEIQLPEPKRGTTRWELSLPSLNFLSAPIFVGLDHELAKVAQKVGLEVVARLPNPAGLTENGLWFWLSEIRNVNAFAVMFEGEEVFGYRTMLPVVADAFRQTGCQVGILELVSQKGDKSLAAMLPEKVVRVHSVSARELVNFSQTELVDRFVRAVRERNIRVCYIRIPFHLKGDPLATVQGYLSTLRQELTQKGFALGKPLLMPSTTAPIWLWGLICLGVVTSVVAFICLFVPLSTSQQWGLAVIGVAVGIALRLLQPIWAAKLVALGITIVAPILAIWFGMRQTLRSGSRWQRTVMGVTTCLAITIACGLIESAAMFDYRFWLKINEFSGVKVSQLLPFLIVIVIVFTQWMDTVELEIRERYRIAYSNLQSLFDVPVKWGQAIGLLLLLAAVAYWLIRTGNEPGLGVPIWELKLRATIEDILGVRPRFKEFLIGHPMLVLSFFFLTGTHLEAKIGQWLTVPTVIGLASMMNTFSHAHTPITLSLLRTFHGVWLGFLIGVLLVLALKWFSAARDRHLQSFPSVAKSEPTQARLGQD